MSLWFRRKDKRGHVHYFSVSVPLLVLIAIVGIMIALLLPLLQWLRQLAH